MRNSNIGSVSHGTMRPEDLIPAFIWELKHQKPFHREDRALVRDIESRMGNEDYYESEDCIYDLESLFDALDNYAPPYFYFGAHPGDGSDYGFWLSECFEDDFEDLKVSDLSEVPKDYYGEILVINDHGNMTLYVRHGNNHLTECWSIV